MAMSTKLNTPHAADLGRGLTFALAVAAGVAVANVYYNQPLLGLIEQSYPGSTVIGLIPTATQLGYAAGLFFLLPLGDLVDRRSAIVLQFLLLAGALVFAALAPTTATLIAASLILGVASTVAQQIVPFAAILAPLERRGAVFWAASCSAGRSPASSGRTSAGERCSGSACRSRFPLRL
jgi:MFS family permease